MALLGHRFVRVCWFGLFVLLSDVGTLDGSAPKSEFADALLGRTTADLLRYDVNKDGVIDIADLVTRALYIPEVGFAARTTSVNEGDGTIAVELTAPDGFQGRVQYNVDGSASSGSDFEPLAGSLWMDGTTATLHIVLRDDAEVEGIESIMIALAAPALGDPACVLGGVSFHTVTIDDNDATWEGSLEISYLQVPFELSLVHADGQDLSWFASDGSGAFPAGDWPAVVIFTPTRFEAAIGPVPTAAARTLLAAAFERRINLLAEPGTARPDDVLDADWLVRGSMAETFQFAGSTSQHLNRTGAEAFTGRFTLRKKVPGGGREEPVLTPLP